MWPVLQTESPTCEACIYQFTTVPKKCLETQVGVGAAPLENPSQVVWWGGFQLCTMCEVASRCSLYPEPYSCRVTLRSRNRAEHCAGKLKALGTPSGKPMSLKWSLLSSTMHLLYQPKGSLTLFTTLSPVTLSFSLLARCSLPGCHHTRNLSSIAEARV